MTSNASKHIFLGFINIFTFIAFIYRRPGRRAACPAATATTSSRCSAPTGSSGPSSSRRACRWTAPAASPPGSLPHVKSRHVMSRHDYVTSCSLPAQVHVEHLGAVRGGVPRHLHRQPGRLHDPQEGVPRLEEGCSNGSGPVLSTYCKDWIFSLFSTKISSST